MNTTIALFPQIAMRIIKEQELIIGPLAWDQAVKVSGLNIINKTTVEINSNPKDTIDKLVAQYERLFGRASKEVCKESVRDLISSMASEEVPSSLK